LILIFPFLVPWELKKGNYVLLCNIFPKFSENPSQKQLDEIKNA